MGSNWQVSWHPAALEELGAVGAGSERVAIAHAIEKLEVDGPMLRSPHQSAVMGESSGLRELRPRRGRSRWRPLYRRIGPRRFAILAIAPEAGIDGAAFERGVRAAGKRLRELR